MVEIPRVAGYVRVSSARQAREGESLDEQEARLQAACAGRGWPQARIYREAGVSASAAKRPALRRLLRAVRAGDVDVVLVKKVDRLSRSLVDFEKTYAILEKHSVDLVSLQESFDSTTAIGRAVLRIVLTFAQLEREQVSERTRDVMAHLARQGRYTGRYVPLGYDLVDSQLVVNEEEAEWVRFAFEKYLEVRSIRKTAAALNAIGARTKGRTSGSGREIGGKMFGPSSVHHLLRDRTYTGEVQHRGRWFAGVHESLIPERQYRLVHRELRRRSVGRQRRRDSAAS